MTQTQHTFNGSALVFTLGVKLAKELLDCVLVEFKATLAKVPLCFITSSLRTLQSATDPAAKVVELYEADMLNLSVQQHEMAVILRGISR